MDLPDIGYEDYSVESLQDQGIQVPRLPQLPGASIENFFMGSGRSQAYFENREALRIAKEEAELLNKIMRAKSLAEERMIMAALMAPYSR
jgi:hypothetical protein|tara:strand:+ start:1217 stop:1486 length:270 start_codon:yes stop_codon:yes gene_type:complete